MIRALYDQHLHSWHSCDSQANPHDNVRAALAAGLAGLTFTEHFDTHPDDWSGCVYDEAGYARTIAQLRSEFGADVYIGKGIEVCYQADQMDFLVKFLADHPFDVVLLSVHYFGGKAIHHRAHWNELDVRSGTALYLGGVLAAVQHCRRLREKHGRVFDVLGHLDLAKRYTQRFYNEYDVSPCRELLDEILRTCIEADLVPEINTSSLRQGLQETMPGFDTVLAYAGVGGQVMTIGSDSHRPADIGAGFHTAANMLQQANLSLGVFRERCLTTVPVDSVR